MSYLETYQEWLHSPALSPAEKTELESIANDPKEIESRFFDQLSFGTAGLRGTMCTGLHQMNVHVIRHTTQAFAEVVKAEGAAACAKGVAICFDCRNHSAEFAKEAACVMAANGIQVRLFEAMRPTPELSFAIRKYGCQAGINVTASHNPKEYNGYKVYWEDGAQLPPKHADAIAAKMKELDVFGCVQRMDYDQAVAQGRILLMGKETDEAFLGEVLNMVNDRACVAQVADRFSLVYTPFHGTGYQLIPEALKRLGLKHILCVPEQMVIDGNFPTVVSPNPENPEGFALAVELAKKNRCDLIVGSDPDADRVGVMVRNALFRRVTLAARGHVRDLGELDDDWGMSEIRWQKALDAYHEQHEEILTNGDARSAAMFSIDESDEKTAHVWHVHQIFADEDGDHDFGIMGDVDLDATQDGGEVIFKNYRVGFIEDLLED